MLKVFLLATFATLSLAAATVAGSQQYLPFNPLWGSSFGTAANLQNVMDESDGGAIALPPGGLKPGQYIAFPPEADFAQVYGPGTNPVFQTGEMDVPAQFVNGRLIPVPKPNNDGNIAMSPQFWQQQGYPSVLNPITTAAGLIPAAPTIPGASQQYPYFASDNLGDLYQFQGYGCMGGECDLEDIMQANALAQLLNPKRPTAAAGTAPVAPATGVAPAPATAPAPVAPAPVAPMVPGMPGLSGMGIPGLSGMGMPGLAPAATGTNPATASSNFNQMMMMMGGDNPLNDEGTQRSRVATDFLKTLPGGNLIAMYGNIGDSPYGESDAFIMTPAGPQVNVDNFDMMLQKTHQAAATQKKTTVTEDPFFWCFLATLVILVSGISVLVVRKRRANTLEDVLMETNYTSHV